MLHNKKTEEQKVEAFKCFDRSGIGQIHTADLLGALKRKLKPGEYELYSQLISTSYGPLINYMDIFRRGKKYK